MRVVDVAAAVCTGMALVVFVRGLADARDPARFVDALKLALEFLLAGGLLRLAVHDSWVALATAAAIVLTRRIIGIGLRFAVRGLGAPVR